MSRHLCLLLALLLTPCLYAQGGGGAPDGPGSQREPVASTSGQGEADSAYKALIESVLDGDVTEESFTQIRLLYAKTSLYDPMDLGARIKGLSDLYKEKDYQGVVDKGSRLLPEMIAIGDYHFYMQAAYRALGKDNYHKFHNLFLFQLLYSIMRSGDGASAASSFTVISVAEEYNVLSYQQANWKTQYLAEDDGHWYDVFELEDGKKVYFNIDIVHEYEAGLFKLK
jgi:hypothetical protein